MRFSVAFFTRYKFGVGELTIKYSNFPESYVKRCVEEVEWKTPRGVPQYLPKTIVHKKTHFDKDSPWTPKFQRMNDPGVQHAKVFLEPLKDWSFFKGDRVEILVGKDKGKQGFIIQVIQERNWVLVEGLNTELRTVGKTKDYMGTIIQTEQPLLVNREVLLVDPADLKATPVEWRYTEEGDKVRVSPRTGRIIPIPRQSEETADYRSKELYKESPKDTLKEDLEKITFQPSLSTFEMDIMKTMGIQEERVPVRTYWY